MKTLLNHLRDSRYIGQEGMREQAAFTIETLISERDAALKQLEYARSTITQIEQLSDNLINVERYTTGDALNDLNGIRNVIKKFSVTDDLHRSAPVFKASQARTESDPPVTSDCAGADTAKTSAILKGST